MGDAIDTRMTKGPIHVALEVCVNTYDVKAQNYVKRGLLLEALQSLVPERDCLSAFLRVLLDIVQVPEAATDYLRSWFAKWPDVPLREPIIRQGIIQAIVEANSVSPHLPIDFYWLAVGDRETYAKLPASYPFESLITRSRWQVTCLLLTPPWPAPISPESSARRSQPANVWIVKDAPDGRTAADEDLVQRYGANLLIARAKMLALTDPMQSPAVREQWWTP